MLKDIAIFQSLFWLILVKKGMISCVFCFCTLNDKMEDSYVFVTI